MKESQAWLILADEYESGRTRSVFLCLTLELADNDAFYNTRLASIARSTRMKMIKRIQSALEGRSGSAAYSIFVPYDEAHAGRVTACLMFAEQAKDEERAKARAKARASK